MDKPDVSYRIISSDCSGVSLHEGGTTDEYPVEKLNKLTSNPTVGGIAVIITNGPSVGKRIIRRGFNETGLDSLDAIMEEMSKKVRQNME